MTDIVTVYAPAHIDQYDSYGLIACELLHGLDALGIYVNAVALGEAQHANQPADVRAITSRPIRPSFGGIMLGYPTGWGNHSPLAHYGPRVGVTMFESSKPPPVWVPILNELDAVVVPSTFCRDAFTAAGVTAPVHVVPLGIGDMFRPFWRERQPDAPYTFLAIGDRGRRKGALEAVQAFVGAFGDDPAYRLVIKTRDVGQRAEILNENIEIVRRDMTADELYQLYLSADCMVFPAKGEGFGLPPREFAATGAPVIATNWGGLADDIDLWGIPLGYELVTADWRGNRSLEGLDLGQWAQPDVNQLAARMWIIANDRDFYKAMAYTSAPAVRELYSWQRFAETVYGIWREVAYKEVAVGERIAAQPVLV